MLALAANSNAGLVIDCDGGGRLRVGDRIVAGAA